MNSAVALNVPSHVALCSPLTQMYPERNVAKKYWEMALAPAEPLQGKQEWKETGKDMKNYYS